MLSSRATPTPTPRPLLTTTTPRLQLQQRRGTHGKGHGAGGSETPPQPETRPSVAWTPTPPKAIPEGALKYKFVRSSGPGGQNVNKVSTACEARFVVAEASWLPLEVRLRLAENEKHRLTHEGELLVFSQEERSQLKNKERCEARILEMITNAWEAPKVRVVTEAPPEVTKEKWVAEKRVRHKVKEMRRPPRDRSGDD